ncbi:MAG: cyclopropane-fatty-acyl-phospholipid synthase family protein [Alphaproteobacteria bacterium]
MLFGQLAQHVVRIGTLTVVDANGVAHRAGHGSPPAVTVRLHDRSLHWKLFLHPELHLGEAYMDGRLTIEDGTLRNLFEVISLNYGRYREAPVHRALRRLSRLLRIIHQHNPVARARKNVAHHYDLSGELYRLFLDKDMQYSCAYFLSENDSLEAAQDNKKRHIAAKLLLRPGQRVLDIGSGWGGLGLSLAQMAEVDVTGVTLSAEQQRVAEARAAQAGLSDRVRFRLKDYRDEHGQYDRIVSVGMFEHVGAKHYREFFRRLKALLKEDGVALLHSIGRMEPPGHTSAWLRKYIFPGGYTPSMSEVLTAIEEAGLWVTDIEILRLHYAETLAHWAKRFAHNRERIRALYDERFCRMFEFYLTGCEAAFRHCDQMVFQMQIARRHDAVPIARDYITDWERAGTNARSAAA